MSRIRFSYLNVFTGKLRLSSFSHSRHVNAHKGSGQISKPQLTQSNSLVVVCYIVVPFPTRDIIFGLSILIRSLNTRNSFVDNMNIEVSSFLAATGVLGKTKPVFAAPTIIISIASRAVFQCALYRRQRGCPISTMYPLSRHRQFVAVVYKIHVRRRSAAVAC